MLTPVTHDDTLEWGSRIYQALAPMGTPSGRDARRLVLGSADFAACQAIKADRAHGKTPALYIAEFDDFCEVEYRGTEPPIVRIGDYVMHASTEPTADGRPDDDAILAVVDEVGLHTEHMPMGHHLRNLQQLLGRGWIVPRKYRPNPRSSLRLYLRTSSWGLPLYVTAVEKSTDEDEVGPEEVWSIEVPDKHALFDRMVALACWGLATSRLLQSSDDGTYIVTERVLFNPNGFGDEPDPEFAHAWPLGD